MGTCRSLASNVCGASDAPKQPSSLVRSAVCRSAPMRVAFVHPDLGLGGAERLIVDAAVELVRHGHQVEVYTAYWDPSRCFEETRGSGGFTVTVAGGWFPRHIGGRLLALCAYIRCVLIALYIALFSKVKYDVIIADQVAVVVPVLRLLTSAKVLFYCHFPDMLLTQRKSLAKRLYRAPLDWLEQTTTGQANLCLVNSKFTAGVFAETFTRLHKRGIVPQVLYPAVAICGEDALLTNEQHWREHLAPDMAAWVQQGPMLLSINRFERKKGIDLAVKALAEYLGSSSGGTCQDHGSQEAGGVRLVLAGGYDPRLPENVEHLQELKQLVKDLQLEERVRFLPSFTDAQRGALLAACTAVVYTPQHEHFGIVPLEAMAAGRPVIAVNNGGPTESVAHGRTGLLCDPTPAAFAAAYKQLLEGATTNNSSISSSTAAPMGRSAREHVKAKFSRQAFGDQLDSFVKQLATDKRNTGRSRR